jgi:hypothetical protein
MERPNRRFLFALALELKCTVGEMEQKLSRSELIEWAAYFRVRETDA